jgi:hypothetical protein
MSDDCSYGIGVVAALLKRHGMGDRWCFVDNAETYHGLSRGGIEAVFRSADLFVDMGTHGAWLEEATNTDLRVLADGEPGYTQIKLEQRRAAGERLPVYDHYYTAGLSVGAADSPVPSAGVTWRPLPHPVVSDLFPMTLPCPTSAATTVMNWRSHGELDFQGRRYGQKNVEFRRFVDLPRLTGVALEVAVSGKAPRRLLTRRGWRVVPGPQTTITFETFGEYIRGSLAEFSVAKNVFVALRTGWFSDRSGAYLASGRPVVQQDTGFSRFLPCGAGLFAVTTVNEAAAALEEIRARPQYHARCAREIACEHLESCRVLGKFLTEVGL